MPSVRRVGPALWIAAALCVALPASAPGAVTIGETFDPSTLCQGVGAPSTYIQSSSPQGKYAAPSAGVITSWSHLAAPNPPLAPTLTFKVVRPAGASTFALVGSSAPTPLSNGVLNTFPTRIAVHSGDIIGVFTDVVYYCLDPSSPGHAFHVVAGDVPPGPTTYTDTAADYKLDLSATLEPDADSDGFGDETQDQCPTDASTQAECDPPETTITKGAPHKTDKTKLKFRFTSSEPDSTFECKLDKKRFKACTSPRKVKRLDEGKHKFKVRAIDPAGNVDPSPAKDKFKVVG